MAIQSLPVFLCLLLCLLSIIWQFISRKSSKTQTVACWPLVGSLPRIIWSQNRIYEAITEIFLSHGNGVGSFFLQGPIFSRMKYLVTCHPQNMEYILKTNFSNFPKGPDFKQIFDDILGDGIVNDDGDSWRLQRKMVHSCLRAVEFRRVIARITQKLVETELMPFLVHVAKKRSVIDLQGICARFAFDSTMTATFGREERHLSEKLSPNEFSDAMDVSQDAAMKRHMVPMFWWKLMRFLNVGKERRLAKARIIMDSNIEECISSKRDLLKNGEENVTDVLSMLINSSGILIDDKLLRDVMLNLFFAGKDTLASGLVWFFYMVAKTSQVERRIVEELNLIVLKKKFKSQWPCVFDIDELKDSVYLHAALCESLRLYPPIPINSKSVVKSDVLPDGTVVTPGTQIFISYYSEGRMPWIWGEDSLDFKPERWIDGLGNLRQDLSSKFFAFNVGPRSCLGKDISFTQMKVFVAALLFNFHVELVDGQQVCPKTFVTLHMKNGLLVHIKERVAS